MWSVSLNSSIEVASQTPAHRLAEAPRDLMSGTSMVYIIWGCCDAGHLTLMASGPGESRGTVLEVCFGCHLGETWKQEDPADKGKQPRSLRSYVESSSSSFSTG